MQAFLHTVGVSVGCVLALAPALLPSPRPTRRWPHVVMALGMAAGHLGGLFLSVAVLALLTAGSAGSCAALAYRRPWIV
ncbi:hypothetical protein [Nonomuraea sp. NPDC049784]|uniref:hypothetical protein n=1 Tax=Nonomuraea sp. NPDC049784 TaxID=3154361 RepID=UPI0033E3F553